LNKVLDELHHFILAEHVLKVDLEELAGVGPMGQANFPPCMNRITYDATLPVEA